MRILVNEFCGHPFQMELSRELARRGHTVLHVYFADNTSTPKGHTELRAEDPKTLRIEGLHIQRKFQKHSVWTRRQADLEYGEAAADCVAHFHPDMVLSANMPLDAQRLLLRAAQRQNAKFIFWMQDVYSVAVTFVLGKKMKPLAWAGKLYFERLEKRLLSQSDAIVCIAGGFADFLASWKVPTEKITVIENWAPLQEVLPMPRDNAWAQEQRTTQQFCFLYSGTLGMKHRPECLLALARHFEQRGDARLLVVAGGAGADWLARNAARIRPQALTLLPFQPYERLSEVLGAADVLITLLDAQAGIFAVPSKTLAYMCAARPLLVAAPEENAVARVVKQAQAGCVVAPDAMDAILAAADRFLENRSFHAQMGANARRYAEQNFSITTITDRFLALLHSLLDEGSTIDKEDAASRH